MFVITANRAGSLPFIAFTASASHLPWPPLTGELIRMRMFRLSISSTSLFSLSGENSRW
jgi:hypothetical protein